MGSLRPFFKLMPQESHPFFLFLIGAFFFAVGTAGYATGAIADRMAAVAMAATGFSVALLQLHIWNSEDNKRKGRK